MMWLHGGLALIVLIADTVLAYPTKHTSDVWADTRDDVNTDLQSLRLYLLRSILNAGESGLLNQNHYDDQPDTTIPKYNIPSQDDTSVAVPARKRSDIDDDLQGVLPPWQEFCRMLEMRNCKRFRRSLPAAPTKLQIPMREKSRN